MGDTTICAVVGHPITHSLSPALHRAAYAELGLDWTFDAIDVAPGKLTKFVETIDKHWRGLAVTMPHKEDVMRLGEPDELAALVGAGNTLLLGQKKRTLKHAEVRNTDVSGFRLALAQVGIDKVKRTRVLGAGGTARAVIVALAKLGGRKVTICVRTPAKAVELAKLASRLGLDAKIEKLGDEVKPANLVVSTLPAGVIDDQLDWALADVEAAFDVIYDPWPTAFSVAANGRDIVGLTGVDLLAGQAVEQITLMTGGQVSFDLLRETALASLGARGRE